MEKSLVNCIACKQAIHPDASVCQFCHSHQSPERWKQIGNILKWFGGITAIFTLLITATQLDDIFENIRNENEAISILVKAGNLQRDHGDFKAAWDSYEKVIQLNPGHKSAQLEQIELAMVWLRNIRISSDRTFTEIVDNVLPVFYRGLVIKQGEEKASLHAHVAWANYLRFRDGVIDKSIVETNFKEALGINTKDVYANAMYAFWINYQRKPDLNELKHYFTVALATEIETTFVRSLQFSTYESHGSKLEYNLEILRVANQMKARSENLPDYRKNNTMQILYRGMKEEKRFQSLMSVVPVNEMLTLIEYLVNGKQDSRIVERRFLVTYLNEKAGAEDDYITAYETLKHDAGTNSFLHKALDRQINRLKHSN